MACNTILPSGFGSGGDAFVVKITTPNTSPTCNTAQAAPPILWSHHQFIPIGVTGVTDPDGNSPSFREPSLISGLSHRP